MKASFSKAIWAGSTTLLAILGFAASHGDGSQAAEGTQQTATSILAAAVEAAGGNAVEKIEGMELNTRRLAFLSGHGQGQSVVDLRLIYPAQMRLEVKVMESQTLGGYGGSGMPSGGGPVTPMTPSEHAIFSYLEGCDGAMWWRKSTTTAEERPCDKRTALRADLTGALGLYRRAAEGKLEGKFLGEQQVQGRQVQVVALSEGDVKLFLDAQTHLLAGASFPGESASDTFDAFRWWADFMKLSLQSAGREQSIWWSEYRRVKFKLNGNEEAIQFPYTWTNYIEGTKFLEEKVTSLKLNGKQNPKIFSKPK